MEGEPGPTSPLQLDVITHRREACAVGHHCRDRANQQHAHPAGCPGELVRDYSSHGASDTTE